MKRSPTSTFELMTRANTTNPTGFYFFYINFFISFKCKDLRIDSALKVQLLILNNYSPICERGASTSVAKGHLDAFNFDLGENNIISTSASCLI